MLELMIAIGRHKDHDALRATYSFADGSDYDHREQLCGSRSGLKNEGERVVARILPLVTLPEVINVQARGAPTFFAGKD
jgi:hypothetical protein